MNILNSLNKKTMIAMMIAATGLSTSMAAAQFKVDYSAKADTEPTVKADKSVMVFQSHDDEHTYEIKIVDGEVTIAKIDGDKVDDDQVKINGEVVIFISDDGETLHEITIPSPKAPKETGSWVSSSGNNFRMKDGTRNLPGFFAPEDGKNAEHKYFATVKVSPPKVMLGINLGEPSKILRKHLKLKDGISAILVESVIEGLPAALSGLEDFDVIVSIDGSDQADGEILRKVLAEKEAGEIMKLIVLRSGDKLKIKVELAEYDSEALGGTIYYDDMEGYEEIKEKYEAEEMNSQKIQLDILTKLEDGEFGHMQEGHIAKLKEQLHAHLSRIDDQRDITIDLRAKAMDAMKQAERQMVEFEDGKLVIRKADGTSRIRLPKMPGQFPGLNPDDLHEHMSGMNERLEHLEARLDHQMDQMGEQMDRLMSMFERLMDRLENNDD